MCDTHMRCWSRVALFLRFVGGCPRASFIDNFSRKAASSLWMAFSSPTAKGATAWVPDNTCECVVPPFADAFIFICRLSFKSVASTWERCTFHIDGGNVAARPNCLIHLLRLNEWMNEWTFISGNKAHRTWKKYLKNKKQYKFSFDWATTLNAIVCLYSVTGSKKPRKNEKISSCKGLWRRKPANHAAVRLD